ncbi:MAG: hypothetical protein ACR2MP_34170 [Streptosporangiaceae bacterium]
MSAPREAKRSRAVRRDLTEAQRRAAKASTPVAKVVTRQVVESKHRAAGLVAAPEDGPATSFRESGNTPAGAAGPSALTSV